MDQAQGMCGGQLLVSCGQRGPRATRQVPDLPVGALAGPEGSEAAESRGGAIAGLNDQRFGEALSARA